MSTIPTLARPWLMPLGLSLVGLSLLGACRPAEPRANPSSTDVLGLGGAGGADGGDDDGGDGGGGDTGEGPEVEPVRWTVLVYMNGDNNLESYVVHDLNELEAGGEGEGVRVLVQADRIDGYVDGDGDWTGARRYEMTGDDDLDVIRSPVLTEMGEIDMGDPAELAAFLAWGRETAPADHYALFLWNHGDSWTVAPPPPSISSDDTSGNWISIAEGELQQGLADFVTAEGPIDLIGFDACYMASFEVAHSLRDQAEVMLASEAWVGGEGVLYTPFLQALRAEPELPLLELASRAASLSVEEGNERTFSAVDLRYMDDVAAGLDALAELGLSGPDGRAEVETALSVARGADPDYPRWYLDLGDLGAVSPTDRSGPLLEAMDVAVAGAFGNGRYDWTSGLTVFTDLDYPGYLTMYSEGAGATWAQETRWDELLIELAAD